MVGNISDSDAGSLAEVRQRAQEVAVAEAVLIEAQRARDAAISRAVKPRGKYTLRKVGDAADLDHTRVKRIRDARSTETGRMVAMNKGQHEDGDKRRHAQVRAQRPPKGS